MNQKPWRQLAYVLAEAALWLISTGILYILISHVKGPELLGTYALAFAWLMLFQGVSSFGIPEFILREVGTHGRAAAGQVAQSLLLGLGSGLAGLLLMICVVRLAGYSADIVHTVTVASLALLPALLNSGCRAVFLALRQMHLALLAALVENAIAISANLYLLFSGHGAIALITTVVVAKAVSAIISVTLLYRQVLPVRPSFDKRLLMETARTVFVFGIGNMLGMATIRINTIMVAGWVDIATVGKFAAATKIMEVGLMIPYLFAQLLMSRIAYSFNTLGGRDPNRFGSWYRLLFALLMPIAVGGWLFARPILEIVFGASFATAAWTLRILMIYLVIESADSVMSVILKAAHRQREDVNRLAFNLLTNIGLNLALLPTLGMVGAAIGRVGGAGVSATLRHLLIVRELTGVNWFGLALKPALTSLGVGSVCYAMAGIDRAVWPLLLYGAGTLILLAFLSSFSLSTIKDMMSFPSNRD